MTVSWTPNASATGAGSPAFRAAAIAAWSTTGLASTGAVFFAAVLVFAGVGVVEVLCDLTAACGAAGVGLCAVLAPGPNGWCLMMCGVATDDSLPLPPISLS